MPRRWCLPLALTFLCAAALAESEVPFLAGRVVDLAKIIAPEARERIDAKLKGLDERTGVELVVLTVPSLDGEPIDRYAYRVASSWKLGKEDKDNGVLLVVASGDRKMRVEVGRGLEPVLTDLESNIVQTDVIIPYFKRNDFSGGIEAGVDALIQGIEGEVEPAPQPASGAGKGFGWPVAVFGFFFLWPFAREAARSGSWFLYVFLMPFFFFLGLAIGWPFPLVTLGAWAVLFPILRKILPKTPKRGGRSGGGWWLGGLGGGGGGWSSGGGGWSGGGGGGFSGGGGSFGGGGSSSSW